MVALLTQRNCWALSFVMNSDYLLDVDLMYHIHGGIREPEKLILATRSDILSRFFVWYPLTSETVFSSVKRRYNRHDSIYRSTLTVMFLLVVMIILILVVLNQLLFSYRQRIVRFLGSMSLILRQWSLACLLNKLINQSCTLVIRRFHQFHRNECNI